MDRAKVLRTDRGFRVEAEEGGYVYSYDGEGKAVTRTAPDGAEQAMDFMDVPQTVLLALFTGLHEAIRKEAEDILARIRADEAAKAAGTATHICRNSDCESVQAREGLCRTCGSETRPL